MRIPEQKSETPTSREGQWMGENGNPLFDWLVRRAEADLGIAQALAVCENKRTDQIKQLESTLVGQISKLQYQIIESREAELMELKSEIFACADRIARVESSQSTADVAKEAVQELRNLRAQLIGRQTELEGRYSGLEKLAQSLGTGMRALEEDFKDKLDGIRNAQAETRHFQSETRSLAERVAQAESATWQARTLASRNSEQLEQTAESLRSEMASLKALCTELKDKQEELSLAGTLLQEIGAKIEEIQVRLIQTQNGQAERDLRLGQLDSGLSSLAERLKGVEELSHRNQALIQAEMSSASGFRDRTAQELCAIDTKLSDAATHQKIRELELALAAKVQESQHQAAQKFLLLESRDAEREKSVRQLSATLGARLAEHEEGTAKKLWALTAAHEELRQFKPELQTLAERIVQANSAIQEAQTRADASANGLARLEDRLANEIAGIHGEITKLAEQQRVFRPPQDELCDIERKFGAALDQIQQQMAVEREALNHWEKGLRESFAAELIGMQARLSERQSQIEHRYSGLERWQEMANASLGDLENQLKKNFQSQPDEHQDSRKVISDLNALVERLSRLEIRAGQTQEQTAAWSRDSEQRLGDLQREISAVKRSLDQRELPSSDAIVQTLEEKFDQALCTKIGELEQRLAVRFSQFESRDADRASSFSELCHHMGERFSAFEYREADIKELKEQIQSLMQRVAELSSEIPGRNNAAIVDPPAVTPRLEASIDPVRPGNGKSQENLSEIQASSEKEQLIKLQERMSAEIERVRAELKERSGRWKVRKSAS